MIFMKQTDSASVNDPSSDRYFRQLPLIGKEGQKKLSDAKVFIAGAGGLGSPVATYLAAAGVGQIILADMDTVSPSNLNRQFLHRTADNGRLKALSGAEKLSALNPEIRIIPVTGKITQESVAEMTGDCRIIIDALDNTETRAVLAYHAYRNGLAYFHAGVSGFGGQISSILPGNENPCLFCLYPEMADHLIADAPASGKKDDKESETGSETGSETESETEIEKPAPFPIMGATAGIIGSLEALEVIKYITGCGQVLCGKLLIWDGLSDTTDIIEYEKNDECPVCSGDVRSVRRPSFNPISVCLS